jgi:hypothetical protein
VMPGAHLHLSPVPSPGQAGDWTYPLCMYGANHLVTATFVQKSYQIEKNPKFIPSWKNAPC